jgi:hypothetical protein
MNRPIRSICLMLAAGLATLHRRHPVARKMR